MKTYPRYIVFPLLWIATSCQTKHDDTGEYIARVDDKYLTTHKISEVVDTNAVQSDYQIREYVSRWVNSELLYKEAQRRGYDRDEKLNRMLEDIKRELAVNLLLENDIYAAKNIRVTQNEMMRYYNTHKKDFQLREDVININYLLTKDKGTANEFRRRIIEGMSWSQALHKLSADTTYARNVLLSDTVKYFKQSDLYPPELWKAAFSLTPGGISVPVTSTAGFYLVTVNTIQHAGEIADFDYAVNEVKERLIIEKKRTMLDDLLKELRKKHKVEINVSYYGMKDTSKVQPPE